MAHETDVFICYRRYGAQTAKLFKRYLVAHNFPGKVWYSDSEINGNYRLDPADLISEAECAVMFIDPDFTKDFLSSENIFECITAREVLEIIKRIKSDNQFRIITVFLDRKTGFRPDEINTLITLISNAGIEEPEETVRLLSQRNAVFFSTATDEEDVLFYNISRNMLPDSFYKNNTANGNFYFGVIPTHVDAVVWDSKTGILPENIYFDLTSAKLPLYRKIDRSHTDLEYEIQNNNMISLVGVDVILSDETEEKNISVRYQKIEYRLFYKTLKLWNQFDLSKEIAEYDWRSDVYTIPNAMGLAFMVITSDNKFLFTRRSIRRKVRPLQYDSSIVEGLKLTGINDAGDEYDTADEDYMFNEIERAFREEICSDCTGIQIQVNGLVIDKAFGQWNIVGSIITPLSSEEIMKIHSLRDDTYEDNEILFVPFVNAEGNLTTEYLSSELVKFFSDGIWDMALAPLYGALLRVGFTLRQINEMTDRI